MPLEDFSKIDAISTDPTGAVVLTIFDAWDWHDESNHLLALQEKINAYFDFIQSGQLLEGYPKARDRRIMIQVMTQFPMSAAGQQLLGHATPLAAKLGADVCHVHLDENTIAESKKQSP